MRSAAELKSLRYGTLAFIDANPVTLTLIPRKRVTSGTGTQLVAQTPRLPQRVCLIDQSTSWNARPGVVQTTDGRERLFDFILLAPHDATVEVNDYWTDANGTWEVAELFPANQYEIRAKVVRRA